MTSKTVKLSQKQADLLTLLENKVLYIDWIRSNVKGYCYHTTSSHISLSVSQATAKSLINQGYLYEDEAEEWKISTTGRAALEAYKKASEPSLLTEEALQTLEAGFERTDVETLGKMVQTFCQISNSTDVTVFPIAAENNRKVFEIALRVWGSKLTN